MTTTIWHEWTTASAETVARMTYEEILEGIIDLWKDFAMDSEGELYPEYINRTPKDVSEQIFNEVKKETTNG